MAVRKDNKELYRKCLDTYGFQAQLNQLQEECGELIVATNHLRRERISYMKLVEEMADVTIMMEQILQYLEDTTGTCPFDTLEKIYQTKIEKLKSKLL